MKVPRSETLESVKQRLDSTFNGAEPAWEIADLFPLQGAWTVEDYFSLTDRTNRLVEFSDGQVEVLSMPTEEHQFIVVFLREFLAAFARQHGLGVALVAPLRVYLNAVHYREPDVVFMLSTNSHRRHSGYWDRADLVMEVVSPDDPDRDHVDKRSEYAQAGIPEYWIVDPSDERITVLTLAGDEYREHGAFRRGESAASVLLSGFAVEVAQAFDAAKQ